MLLFASAVAATPAEDAARGLFKRVLPAGRDAEFVIVIQEAATETVEVSNSGNGTITVHGTSPLLVAMGLNHYLKYTAFCQLSWSGDNLDLADPLPRISDGNFTLTRQAKYGYYENVCTVSYTMAFWKWGRWEREIDWMALNGINAPLAFTGQEYVWQETFRSFGLNDTEIGTFFSGPAFLAWQRMGNMRGWGGPLPQYFLSGRKDLQIQILQRMRSLSFTPILPAFAGHIPEAMTKHFPKMKVSRLPDWNRMPGNYGSVYTIVQTDPMFVQVGKKFLELQTEIYGTDHLYNADQYNEMTPPSSDSQFLKDASGAMYNYMTAVDKDAIWVMQGWLFLEGFWNNRTVEAYLSGVPDSGMLILDLYSDSRPQFQRFNSYFGKPFIWNMLHDFGGDMGLAGKMPIINTAPHTVLKDSSYSMVGVGLTPESTLQNYPIYEFMLENTWRSSPTNTTQWIIDYYHRRYGKVSPNAEAAWVAIQKLIYNEGNSGQVLGPKAVIELRPQLSMTGHTSVFYDKTQLVRAVKSLLLDSDTYGKSETYYYDVADLTRQALSDYSQNVQRNITAAFNAGNSPLLKTLCGDMMGLISDFDALQSSNKYHLLGNWTNDARTLAQNEADAELFDYNARNQLTLWGPTGQINDYASKQWGGLIKTYYGNRWSLFTSMLMSDLDAHKPFDQKAYDTAILNVEEAWQKSKQNFLPHAVGDSVEIAKKLLEKYFPTIQPLM